MRDILRSAVVALGAAAVLALGAVADGRAQPVPEGPSGWTDKIAVTARRFMIAAANPHAVDAGYAMLARGGSAVDAAIAAQLVLNLVEPQSSGIGGGAFMLVHDAKRNAAGRVRRPRDRAGGGAPDRFLDRDGKPVAFRDAVVGGRSVGVPGTVALLEATHRAHGRLPWAELFAPAIALAEHGFAVSPRLYTLLVAEKLLDGPRAQAYFYAGPGRPHPVGHVLKNPAFARTLRAIATGGANAFYEGEIARDVVDTANLQPEHRGDLTLADLAAYRVVVREPVCGPYRGYRVCGMPPPSSGGITLLQMLAHAGAVRRRGDGAGVVLERPLHERGRAPRVRRPRRVHRGPGVRRGAGGAARPGVSRGARRADLAAVLAGSRQARRSAVVRAGAAPPGGGDRRDARAAVDVAPVGGRPPRQRGGDDHVDRGRVRQPPDDRRRLPAQQPDDRLLVRAGGRRPARRQPRRAGQAAALVDGADHRLRPRRPRVHGRRFGARRQHHQLVAKTTLGVVDWKLDPQAAVALPNFGSVNGPTLLERGTPVAGLAPKLEALGHDVQVVDLASGTQLIVRTPGGWTGAADPRREGTVRGQ